ncbi:MAG: hypothetical protein ABI353_24175 [Isosphaeraceae bacterium]
MRIHEMGVDGLREEDQDIVLATFHAQRAAAEQWQQARVAFMTARLNAGRHPDTDPTFWDGYSAPVPPELPSERPRRAWIRARLDVFPFRVVSSLLLATATVGWLVLRHRARTRKPSPLDLDRALGSIPKTEPGRPGHRWNQV